MLDRSLPLAIAVFARATATPAVAAAGVPHLGGADAARVDLAIRLPLPTGASLERLVELQIDPSSPMYRTGSRPSTAIPLPTIRRTSV